MVKKIAACGDSWYCSHLKYPDQSWPELLSKDIGWQLVSLARAGASNFNIVLQVQKAIELKVDFVVLGCTYPTRIEVPMIDSIQDSPGSVYFLKPQDLLDKSKYKKTYVSAAGLSNVNYSNHPDLSSLHPWTTNPTFIDSEIVSMLESDNYKEFYTDDLTYDQKQALRLYQSLLFDVGIKQQYDMWIISEALRQLTQANIPFFMTTYPLFDNSNMHAIAWVSQDSLITLQEFDYFKLPAGPARFHYDTTGASIWTSFIKTKMLAKGVLQ